MKLLLLTLLLLAVCQPTFAQQDVRSTGLEVTFHSGIYHGGSGRSIVKQFRDSGFGEERTSSSFFGTDDNPLRDETSLQLGVYFPVKQKIRAKGLLLYRFSEVEGQAMFFEQLDFNTSVLTAGALGYMPLFRHFRIGAGPALHLTRGRVLYGGAEQVKDNSGKAGFVLESGFTSPANKRLFVDLQAQYVYAGRGDFGSHTFDVDITEQSRDSRTVDFTNTKLSSFILSVGIGYRLYSPE
jgi:hypothetical protein